MRKKDIYITSGACFYYLYCKNVLLYCIISLFIFHICIVCICILQYLCYIIVSVFCFTCSCFSKNYWLSLNPSTAITTFKTITKNTMNILISSYHSTVAHHSHAQTIPRGSLAIVLGPCESNSSAFFICSKWAFLAFRHL